MTNLDLDFTISRLGECRIPSPMHANQFVGDDEHVLYHGQMEEVQKYLGSGKEPPQFETAGPREKSSLTLRSSSAALSPVAAYVQG